MQILQILLTIHMYKSQEWPGKTELFKIYQYVSISKLAILNTSFVTIDRAPGPHNGADRVPDPRDLRVPDRGDQERSSRDGRARRAGQQGVGLLHAN